MPIIHLLVAASIAGSTGSLDERPIDRVCGYALEVLGQAHRTDQEFYELYIGRMELRMREEKTPESQKELVRSMCHVYLLGAGKAIELIERVMGDASQ